jgi:dynein heavy chain
MHAVCVMMERKVEKTPRKDNPKIIEDNWWFTAQRFMSDKNFLEAVIEKIRNQFLNDPEFKPSRVAQASKAAKGLCEWIIKLEQYHTLVVYIRPKKQALQDSKQRFKVAEDSLAIKQTELKKIVM